MKKMIFLMLVFFMGISVGTNAQVNIGSEDGPQPGAVLDLSQGSQKLGLILPNVPLTNVGTWQLDAGTGVEGTVVYNTNADLKDAGNQTIGKGIFVWVGNGWQAAKSGAGSALVLGFDLTPATSTVSTFVNGTIEFTASGFLPDGAAAGVNWVIPSGSAATIQSSTVTTCVVEGLSVGQAILTVTSLDGNVEKLVTIDVQEVTVTGFALDKSVLELKAGGVIGTVTASGFTFSDGQSHPAPAVSWVTNGDVKGSLENKQATTYTVTSGNAEASWTVVASSGTAPEQDFTVNVTCPTADASLTSGNATQSVAKETAIANITYSLTDVTSATVTGLPDGVNYNTNNNVLTISGTTPDLTVETPYTYTVKATNVCGTETTVATGTITVTVNTLTIGSNTYTTGNFGDAGTWMTENLREVPSGGTLGAGTSTTIKYYNYPNNTADNLASYGYLYSWAAATNSSSTTTDQGATNHTAVQGICPTGWHLPSDYEWTQLETVIGTDATQTYSTTAGASTAFATTNTTVNFRGGNLDKKMKTASLPAATGVTTGAPWDSGTSKSSSANGFNALPAGYASQNAFANFGKDADFWTASAFNTGNAWRRNLTGGTAGSYRSYYTSYFQFSVRCKKD